MRTYGGSARSEGVALGLIVATATWAWVALADAIMGHPFQTFEALGGVAAFTIVHYSLNVVFGIVLASAVHSTERTPSVAIAIVFGLVLFQVAFAMVTPLLAEFGVGNFAWVAIFGGSLLGTAIALGFLARRHPLIELLHRAEEER